MSYVERLCWNPVAELIPEAEMEKVQWKKLKSMLEYVYNNSEHYKQVFKERNITPADIKSLDDFYKKIPLTYKEDLRDMQRKGYPFGSNICVPYAEVRMITASTGTTGKPTYTGFTQRDLEVVAECTKRVFWLSGARPGDVYLHALAISNWISGIPCIRAIMDMGVTVLPIGIPTPAPRMITMIQDQHPTMMASTFSISFTSFSFLSYQHPTMMASTPSYALHLAGEAMKVGLDPRKLTIRKMGCGGEPGAGIPSVRKAIEDAWDADVRDVMGTPEQISADWAECHAKQGMHFVAREFVLNELVDPETKEHIPMREGAKGALVYTVLEKDCAPLLRFYVADEIEVFTEKCECGYPSYRIRVTGRYDEMLKIRGVKTWPSSVHDVLRTIPKLTGEFRMVLPEKPIAFTVDRVRLKVEHKPGVKEEEFEDVKREITEKIRSALMWSPDEIELVPPGTIPPPVFKAQYIEIHK